MTFPHPPAGPECSASKLAQDLGVQLAQCIESCALAGDELEGHCIQFLQEVIDESVGAGKGAEREAILRALRKLEVQSRRIGKGLHAPAKAQARSIGLQGAIEMVERRPKRRKPRGSARGSGGVVLGPRRGV